LLVENGADVNLQDRFVNTPLHEAVQSGQIEAIQKLIQVGADVNIRANKELDYWGRQFLDRERSEHKLST
jgi:ankyrin repeat protein